MIHPSKRAEALASAIRSDPIAAAQIKEFLPAEELALLFSLANSQDLVDAEEEIERLSARCEELERELAKSRD